MFFRMIIIVTMCLAICPKAALAKDAASEGATNTGTSTDIAEPLPIDESVYDDLWLSIGIGAALIPSYEGSNDYVFSPVPLVQGKLGFVRINPRPAGLALDFLPKPERKPGSGAGSGPRFSLGINMRYRANRTGDVQDDIVALAQELDEAFEIGPTAGVSFPAVFTPEDNISINLDTRWDISGAHNGFVFEPNANYFTPLSRGAAVSITVGAKFIDDDFADYYFSVTPQDSALTGLQEFRAGGGLKNLNSTVLVGVDLDGNLGNGGAAVFVAGGYTRFVGDVAASPFTSERGDANQFVGALGLGYTF